MFKYCILLTALSFVSAFSQINIALKPKCNIKYESNLKPLNCSIYKYKIEEYKNNRLKANNIINYSVAKYYFPVNSIYKRYNTTFQVIYNDI
jgi:hypothetical protein